MQITMTIKTVEIRNGANGEYAYLTADIEKLDGSTYPSVVMAFNAAYTSVKPYLVKGKKRTFTMTRDDGVLKILGRAKGMALTGTVKGLKPGKAANNNPKPRVRRTKVA